MFVALYRWKVKAGRENAFREAWIRVTRANCALYGSLGSRLHRSEDGTWIAYAQWPSREDWEYAWRRGVLADPESSAVMRECVEADSADEQFKPSLALTVIEDMLEKDTHPAGRRL
jgi:hypothetical protein